MRPEKISEEILAEAQPARLIDRVRLIWPEIEKLRDRRLTYRQIVEYLPKYGITLDYKQFLDICRRIQKARPLPGDSVARAAAPARPIATLGVDDPIEVARRKIQEKSKSIWERKE